MNREINSFLALSLVAILAVLVGELIWLSSKAMAQVQSIIPVPGL